MNDAYTHTHIKSVCDVFPKSLQTTQGTTRYEYNSEFRGSDFGLHAATTGCYRLKHTPPRSTPIAINEAQQPLDSRLCFRGEEKASGLYTSRTFSFHRPLYIFRCPSARLSFGAVGCPPAVRPHGRRYGHAQASFRKA